VSDEILNVNWLGTLIVCCIVVITSFHAARLAQVEIIYNIMNISLACIHLKAYKALYAVCSTPNDTIDGLHARIKRVEGVPPIRPASRAVGVPPLF
jgi:hypothetical protein